MKEVRKNRSQEVKQISSLRANEMSAAINFSCHPELVSGSHVFEIPEPLQEDPFCTKSADFGKSRQVRNDMLLFCHYDRNMAIQKETAPTSILPHKGGSITPSLMREGRDGCQSKKIAFTLAEVLITLGIIGIVAAMTLPGVVSNYRKKALQSALLKTYSELQQVNQQLIAEGNDLMDIELGDRIRLIMGKFHGKYALANDSWHTIKQTLQAIYHNKGLYHHSRKNLGAHPTCDNGGVWTDNQGRLWLFNDTDKQICVDINGTKGPNAYGYDYFIFYPDANGKIIPHYTDIENEFSLSHYDYTYYAVTDQHPTEKGKTYWKDYLKL